jgi:hypothetical protein
MQGREVYVVRAEVVRHYASRSRTVYRLTLSCGCAFNEDRPIDDAPPNHGEQARCFAMHGASGDQR